MLGYDDSLDVFGVHCVGGILGALLTGVFNDPALGGTGVYDYVANRLRRRTPCRPVPQLWGVGVTLVWSGCVARIAFNLVDPSIGLRVTEDRSAKASIPCRTASGLQRLICRQGEIPHGPRQRARARGTRPIRASRDAVPSSANPGGPLFLAICRPNRPLSVMEIKGSHRHSLR